MTLNDFKPGDRVEIHPACDRWMFGDMYATVTKVGRTKLTIKFDRSGAVRRWDPENIFKVIR